MRLLARLTLRIVPVVAVGLTFAGVAAADATLERFSPQGTVKQVRQAAARFSEPMVALGDPGGGSDPFDVSCPEPGTGRWVDPRQWVYDFARDLPAGLRCTFTLRSGLQTLAGTAVAPAAALVFSTGGPAVRESTPRAGTEWIEEDQAFLLILDAEATGESVERHVSFSVEGLTQRVGTRLVTGRPRDLVIKSRYRQGPPGPVVVIQARQRFPNGARVALVWGHGVSATTGVATDQDQTLEFKVRDPFTASFECERENRNAGCVPVSAMRVKFTSPVAVDLARRVTLRDPGGRAVPPVPPEVSASTVQYLTFKGPFPEKASFTVEMPAGIMDEAGRPLANAGRFPLAVKTEGFPPLAKFPARFGIVELTPDSALPVTLRNVEPTLAARMVAVPANPKGFREWVRGRLFRIPPERAGEILPWIRRVAAADRESSVFSPAPSGGTLSQFGIPKPAGAQPMEVVGIPLREAGFYVVEIESARLGAALLGKPKPMYVPAAALVTNLSVHLKWGRESSLAWVTTLDAARPVEGARVVAQDCAGKTLWQGRTDAHGIARIDGLPLAADVARCPSGPARPWAESFGTFDGGLLVIAQTPDDLSFAHSSWNQGIEPWRWDVPSAYEEGSAALHTILDRSLLRAGETLHMKHVARLLTQAGFALVPADRRPTRLAIRHLGSDDQFERPLRWDATGIAEDAWPIPRGAKLGTYELWMERPLPPRPKRPGQPAEEDEEAEVRSWVTARFQVQEFRVPLMRGTLRPPIEPLVAASELPVDLSVQYLAGGPAARHPAIVRAQVRPRGVPSFDGFEEFTFGAGPVKEGIVRRGLRTEEGEDDSDAPTSSEAPAVHQRHEVTLDPAGTARVTITALPKEPTPKEVLTELEFRDPNGETQTVATRIPLWPARLMVGIRPESWAASRERLRAQVAVLDLAGQPVSGVPVTVDLLERKFFSHRKRLVGGFYAYEHVQETKMLGPLCRGVTDSRGLLACEGKPPAEGRLIVQASARDAAGNPTISHTEVWVAGSEDWWFETRDSDRIDLLPERRRYEPGETARFQVRMPFRTATALVTVEREGILDARVVSLSGTEPVIDLPVKTEWAPNVFISALVVRGRVGGAQPTALVDLGRPAFKLGLGEIRVGWRAHELKVSVAADRAVYRTREKARIKVTARTASGAPPPPGSEVAVAAVDEGLLELLPNPSWTLLDAMMRRRAYQVATATAQGHVIGKRHFGLKAVAQGGAGGQRPTRELFDTLLFWNARVALDARGEATVEIPLNDSITSFRVVAVATGGLSLFGTGATSIRATQDLMVLSGIVPLAREGDRVRAEVTVRNATDRPMSVRVAGRVVALAGALEARDLPLAPGEAKAVTWDVTVPVGVTSLAYEIDAQEGGSGEAGAKDRLRVTQRVAPAVPVRVQQAAMARLDQPLRVPVERPAAALPGAGGIAVTLRPSLLDGLTGVRDWMARYPYTCLEQQVSRAVALRDTERWDAIAASLPAHLDGDGLLKYFPTMTYGSEVLTAYVLALAHESGGKMPADVLERAQAGLAGFVKGTIARRELLVMPDLSIRKLAALEALSRYGKSPPELAGSIAIEPNLWPTSAVLDWWNVLRRVPAIPNRAARLREAEQIVRARLTVQATVLGFSTERTDRLWWLMVSSDVNALRLILTLLESGEWRDEVPPLVRGALGRQRNGAWDLTVANAWGTLAVEKFSQRYEWTPVSGASTASIAGRSERVDWGAAPKGTTTVFPWPAQRDTVAIEHAGAGQPWVMLEARAAVPLQAPRSAGYRITKTLTRIEPGAATTPSPAGATPASTGAPLPLKRGDLLRVRLEIDAQSDMTWVVVDDPVPAGASHLGTGLARESAIGRAGERRAGRAWPAFEERGFEAFRAYYAYAPKGPFVVEYTIRLNQAGRFLLPPTRVEALYAPEAFGEIPNAPIEVEP